MNEADLLQQVRNGNTGAYRFLVLSYQGMVLHLVGRMVRQPEDVEDICQLKDRILKAELVEKIPVLSDYGE